MPIRARAASRVRERGAPPPARGPDRQAEHAAQPRDRGGVPVLVGVDDHLGVGGRVEAVARGFQVTSQFPVVVDFAVEDDPDRAILVVDWLVPGREIDDAEPPHAERDAGVHPDTLVVRAAMADDGAHAVDEGAARLERERGRNRGGLYETGDATHIWSLVLGPRSLVCPRSLVRP